MKATNAGHDDVDASLRRVTRPLNGRIDHAIETATYQLHNNKTAGKQRCIELFNTVGHILDVLEVLLGSESQEFTETCDRVAESIGADSAPDPDVDPETGEVIEGAATEEDDALAEADAFLKGVGEQGRL